MYRKAPISKAYEETGKGPISSRWVGINKGDDQHPNYRSRLCATDIKVDRREDLFAATPPLEAKRLLLSFAVTDAIGFRRWNVQGGMQIGFADL